MKSNNKKQTSILTFIGMLILVAVVTGVAYVATTAIGKGQSTRVEQASGGSATEEDKTEADTTEPEKSEEESNSSESDTAEGDADTTEEEKTEDEDDSTEKDKTDDETKDAEDSDTVEQSKLGFFDENHIKLGLDLQGGVNIVYEPKLEGEMTDEELSETMQAAQALIQKRLTSKGYTEAEVAIEGNKRLRVDIPGVADPQKAIEEIGAAGMLHFIDAATGEEIVTGKNVKNAYAGQDRQTGQFHVGIEMDEEGTKLFSDYTKNNIGKMIVIMLDNTILSTPSINAHITDGGGVITGNFGPEEAKDLASSINAGALPFTLEAISSTGVGPELGMDALRTSLLAGIIGFIAILLFMLVMYRGCGIAADIALIFYVGLVILALTMLNSTLTLSGIAGILLSIGMAVDANVIIFSRIKEEMVAGRSVRAAVDAGFGKAFSAILDGNITTLIAGGVLYIFGTGLIKSFATTLMVGIVISMFTALVITRSILKSFVGMGIKKTSFYANIKKQEKETTKMNIIGSRKKFYAISIVLILIGVGFMGMNMAKGEGSFNQDIEFTGGSLIEIEMERQFTNELRDELAVITKEVTGKDGARITSAGDTGVLITMTRADSATRKELFDTIKEKYNLTAEGTANDEDFSPTISGEIKVGAVKAVVAGIVLILIYITFRFKDYRFGTSAVVALAHDVLIMLAVYAVFRIPLNNSFIAGMLTIVGYSINDTIIIFDRIRENKAKLGNKAGNEEEIINTSISQTIGRSIITSVTSVVMVILLFIFGTEAVKEFAFPLIIGILAGTYSSIFVASPVWYQFVNSKRAKKEVQPKKA